MSARPATVAVLVHADAGSAARRRLVPGAVNAVCVDMFRNELSGMLGFGVIDAEFGTLAIVDKRLTPDVRQDVAARVLDLLDGRAAPAFVWVPVDGAPTVEDGKL